MREDRGEGEGEGYSFVPYEGQDRRGEKRYSDEKDGRKKGERGISTTYTIVTFTILINYYKYYSGYCLIIHTRVRVLGHEMRGSR